MVLALALIVLGGVLHLTGIADLLRTAHSIRQAAHRYDAQQRLRPVRADLEVRWDVEGPLPETVEERLALVERRVDQMADEQRLDRDRARRAADEAGDTAIQRSFAAVESLAGFVHEIAEGNQARRAAYLIVCGVMIATVGSVLGTLQ